MEGAEVCHRTRVDVLRVRRHVADLHFVDHALPQRAHRLRHGITPVNWNCTERAILADGAVKFEERDVYVSMRKSDVVRHVRNGSVEPFPTSDDLWTAGKDPEVGEIGEIRRAL